MALKGQRKIESILDKQKSADYQATRSFNEGDLMERAEKVRPLVDEQLKNFEEVENIIKKARELLREYQASYRIPESELDIEKSGFDDARLLAFCMAIEERAKKRTVH